MNIQTLPRTVITGYFTALRLPLDVAAKAARQQDNLRWPPTLVFESVEAAVETKAGQLLHDDVLLEIGQVRREKLAEVRKAVELEALADSTRAHAQEELTERRERAEQERQKVADRARQREEKAEQDARRKEAEVQKAAAKSAALARDAKAAHEKSIEQRERAVKTSALAKESEALRTQEQALKTAEAVDRIDDAIEKNKAARKSG